MEAGCVVRRGSDGSSPYSKERIRGRGMCSKERIRWKGDV